MIFILLIVGIILVVINVRAIQKEKKSFDTMYNFAKENVTDYEIEIGKLRKEFAETLTEIQSEVEDIKAKVDHYEHINLLIEKETYKTLEKDNEKYIEDDEKNHGTQDIPLNFNNTKIEQVNKMLREGLTVDDIASELQLGKGEVLLIKELYLK